MKQLTINDLYELILKQIKKGNGDCRKCKACWGLKKGQSVYFEKH